MENSKRTKSPHQPVLYHESLKYLQPQSGKKYVDGTLGAGGHARGILARSSPKGVLLGLDIDTDAIDIARKNLADFGDRCIIHKNSYANIKNSLEIVGWGKVDGIILDLGISSMQIDRAEKGFSFQKDAPLDMRFDRQSGLTAGDLVNSLSEEEIASIIWEYGDESRSRQIARSIVMHRPINTTLQLADVIVKAYKGNRGKRHPATKTFQALRIAVNDEMKVLEKGLIYTLDSLNSGGILAIITFHSLEDRKVKQFFQKESKDCLCPPEQIICDCDHTATIKRITKKPVTPSTEEILKNPRARSAKLRVVMKK